jgi:hypothetical protein
VTYEGIQRKAVVQGGIICGYNCVGKVLYSYNIVPSIGIKINAAQCPSAYVDYHSVGCACGLSVLELALEGLKKISGQWNIVDIEIIFFPRTFSTLDAIRPFISCCGLLVFTLKMQAAWFSEMLISFHVIIWCHNLEDQDMNLHHHGNLKSYVMVFQCLVYVQCELSTSCKDQLLLRRFPYFEKKKKRI